MESVTFVRYFSKPTHGKHVSLEEVKQWNKLKKTIGTLAQEEKLEGGTSFTKTQRQLSEMATYTFIANYKGGIYIRQVSAENILQACRVWANRVINEQDIQDLNSTKFIKNFNEDLDDLPPVPLENTPNVWCFTVGSGRNFMIINVVKTEMKTIETQLPVLADAEAV